MRRLVLAAIILVVLALYGGAVGLLVYLDDDGPQLMHFLLPALGFLVVAAGVFNSDGTTGVAKQRRYSPSEDDEIQRLQLPGASYPTFPSDSKENGFWRDT